MVKKNHKVFACRSPLSSGIGRLDSVFLLIIPNDDNLIISVLYSKQGKEVSCYESIEQATNIYFDLILKGWNIMNKNDIDLTFGDL